MLFSRPKNRTHRSARILASAAAAAAIVGALPSGAEAHGTMLPCTDRAESTVFAPWGDDRNYFLAPNGGFEQGTAEWKLSSKATVVTGNEPWKVGASTDTKALRLAGMASAESRTICTGVGEEALRFFVYNPGNGTDQLRVRVVTDNISTGIRSYSNYSWDTGSLPVGWSASPPVVVPASITDGETQATTITFQTYGMGTWLIDDVYVDPFKSR